MLLVVGAQDFLFASLNGKALVSVVVSEEGGYASSIPHYLARRGQDSKGVARHSKESQSRIDQGEMTGVGGTCKGLAIRGYRLIFGNGQRIP